MYGLLYSSSIHCTPLERQTVVSGEVYKHLVPPEPEPRLIFHRKESP